MLPAMGAVPPDAERALATVLSRPWTLARLTGGYSWRTYRVTDATGRRVVLRIAPGGGTLEPYEPEREAAALRRVAGIVPAPTVLATGQGFIVEEHVDGDVRRPRDVTDPGERRRYRRAFAEALGDLHRISEPGDPDLLLREELGRMRGQYEAHARRRYPAFEHALRWLDGNFPRTPAATGARFCHGDYRFSNLAWRAPGDLAGVLDWERAGPGDPLADVAFTRRYSGWCAVAGEVLSAYEEHSGLAVDEERVGYLERFEKARSYTASMRGHRAYLDGRNDDPRLREIGEAGERGMRELLTWR